MIPLASYSFVSPPHSKPCLGLSLLSRPEPGVCCCSVSHGLRSRIQVYGLMSEQPPEGHFPRLGYSTAHKGTRARRA